ncbi:unnamed protein product [Phytomonas sp. EM1]|nr:unnamed protein product [Phytomonas sp. EM1]|eukprot:CCW63984.1 unnamed protein product [Phytomonas sp. isolate EM1]
MPSDRREDSLREGNSSNLDLGSPEAPEVMYSLSLTGLVLPSNDADQENEKKSERHQESCTEFYAGAEIASPKRNEVLVEEGFSVASWDYVKQTARHVVRSINLFKEKVKCMKSRQIILTLIFIILLMSGNVMQILMLNFWLVSFPSDGAPGNYTAFALPGIVYSMFFLILLCVYIIVKRPNLRFAGHTYGWKLIILIGFYDTFNSWLATYAASHTPEMLQSLFTNLSPLYSMFFSKWILHDPRHYLNIWIVVMVVLTVAGILVVLGFDLAEGSPGASSQKWFILIFFSSIPFRVLMNVYQSLYLIVYTSDATFVEWLCYKLQGVPKGEDDSDASPSKSGRLTVREREYPQDNTENNAHLMIPCRSRYGFSEVANGSTSSRREFGGSMGSAPRITGVASRADIDERQREVVLTLYHQGEDAAVKLVMLAGETFVQMCFTLALLPADAIPWLGGSSTVGETWTNFKGGVRSFFTIPKNFIYGFLYTLGFVFNYIGAAYVNHRSVTLCSLITQLSSPLTGLLLVMAPSLNALSAEDTSWGRDLIAILMLTFAALVYVVWEELTHKQMQEGERVLKMKKLRVRPIEVNDILSEEGKDQEQFGQI